MSYTFEKKKLKTPPEFDRRVKLLDEDKEVIRHKYATGQYSLRSLAKEYGVTHKTILLIVNPKSQEKSRQRNREHWSDYIPTKEERAATVREHRRYKRKLYYAGVLMKGD